MPRLRGGKMIHYLKTVQPFFDDAKSGKKKFEVRTNDRDYRINDEVVLQEYDAEKKQYTGEQLQIKKIIYILDDENYCKDGFVVLGLE
jgi:hypothetical protein